MVRSTGDETTRGVHLSIVTRGRASGRTDRLRPGTGKSRVSKPRKKSKSKPKPKANTKTQPKSALGTRKSKHSQKPKRRSASGKTKSIRTCKQLHQQQPKAVSVVEEKSSRVLRDVFAIEKRHIQKDVVACSTKDPTDPWKITIYALN